MLAVIQAGAPTLDSMQTLERVPDVSTDENNSIPTNMMIMVGSTQQHIHSDVQPQNDYSNNGYSRDGAKASVSRYPEDQDPEVESASVVNEVDEILNSDRLLVEEQNKVDEDDEKKLEELGLIGPSIEESGGGNTAQNLN